MEIRKNGMTVDPFLILVVIGIVVSIFLPLCNKLTVPKPQDVTYSASFTAQVQECGDHNTRLEKNLMNKDEAKFYAAAFIDCLHSAGVDFSNHGDPVQPTPIAK